MSVRNEKQRIRRPIEALGRALDWVLEKTKGNLTAAEIEYLLPKWYRFCAALEQLEDRTRPTSADVLQYPHLDIRPSVSLLRSA